MLHYLKNALRRHSRGGKVEEVVVVGVGRGVGGGGGEGEYK